MLQFPVITQSNAIAVCLQIAQDVARFVRTKEAQDVFQIASPDGLATLTIRLRSEEKETTAKAYIRPENISKWQGDAAPSLVWLHLMFPLERYFKIQLPPYQETAHA